MKMNLCLWAALFCAAAQGALSTLDLSGQWEAVAGHYNDSLFIEKKSGTVPVWNAAPVPGSWSDIEALREGGQEKIQALACVWYRTRFTGPRNCTGMQAVLRLLGARWEVAAWLNGEKIGSDLSGYGALEFNLPQLKESGENVVVVRTGGWSTMPKSAAQGLPLFPTSSGPHWGPRTGAIMRGAEIVFYQDGRINKIKIDPELASSSVIARAEIENVTKFHGRQRLEWSILEKESGKAVCYGEQAIPYHHSLRLKGNPTFYAQKIKFPAFQKWSPESPFLYTAKARLFLEGKLADSVDADFGMREFKVKSGQFELNRKPVFLRGGNFFGQDYWMGSAEDRKNPGKIRDFMVDGARTFNFNCIRTHTHPLAGPWNRAADESGLLIVSEMTLIVNGSGWVLTPDERKVFQDNVLKEYGRILPEIWNHPSTVMWSISNESFWPDSGAWDAWESGPLTDWFTACDSTRPLLRAANPSRDVLDNHVFDGWWDGVEGDFLEYVRDIGRVAPGEGRPVTISEYMQFSRYTAAKWLGSKVIPEPDGNNSDWNGNPSAMNFHAQLAMEYTECMRVNGIKMILPYLFPNNGTMDPERINLPPVYYALKNAYSPQLAALELFNRHHATEAKIKIPVSFINDFSNDKPVKLLLYLSPENPGFVPERLELSGLKKLSEMTLTGLKPGIQKVAMNAALPEKEGKYWLILFTSLSKAEPVMSRREIILYGKTEPFTVSKTGCLGFPEPLRTQLQKAGFAVLTEADLKLGGLPRIIVAGPDVLSKGVLEPEKINALTTHVENGGHLLVMEQTRWLYPEWIRIRIERMAKNGSGAAFFTSADTLSRMLPGLKEEDFYRFNGMPGDVITHRITEIKDQRCVPLMKAQDGWKTLWESVALAEASVGQGKVVFCQLNLSKRLNKNDPEYFDPVCEKAFYGMLRYLER